MNKRLNTDQLIQNTRESYDATKFQQRINELELTLELRNKELQYTGAQILTCKEENKERVSRLERELAEARKELGETKVKSVREVRALQEVHQQEIKRLKAEQDSILEQRQREEQKKYQTLMTAHNNQVNSLQEKYDSYIRFQKQQSETCKNVSQEQSHSLEVLMNQLQEEKKTHLKARKEAERTAQLYKQALEQFKVEYEGLLGEKEENIASLKGEVEGLKLKERFLQQKLDELQENQFQVKNQNFSALELVKQTNVKLLHDIENLKERLRIKQDQLLSSLNKNESLIVPGNFEPYQCNHRGLINQLETNLRGKQEQIKELKNIVSQWTAAIGFDRPLSQRLTELTEKGENTSNLNKNWLKSLKQRSKKSKIGGR